MFAVKNIGNDTWNCLIIMPIQKLLNSFFICEEVLQPRNERNVAELPARFLSSLSKTSLRAQGALVKECIYARHEFGQQSKYRGSMPDKIATCRVIE